MVQFASIDERSQLPGREKVEELRMVEAVMTITTSQKQTSDIHYFGDEIVGAVACGVCLESACNMMPKPFLGNGFPIALYHIHCNGLKSGQLNGSRNHWPHVSGVDWPVLQEFSNVSLKQKSWNRNMFLPSPFGPPHIA